MNPEIPTNQLKLFADASVIFCLRFPSVANHYNKLSSLTLKTFFCLAAYQRNGLNHEIHWQYASLYGQIRWWVSAFWWHRFRHVARKSQSRYPSLALIAAARTITQQWPSHLVNNYSWEIRDSNLSSQLIKILKPRVVIRQAVINYTNPFFLMNGSWVDSIKTLDTQCNCTRRPLLQKISTLLARFSLNTFIITLKQEQQATVAIYLMKSLISPQNFVFSCRSTHQRLANDVITIPYACNMFRLRVHSKGECTVNIDPTESIAKAQSHSLGCGAKAYGEPKTIPSKKYSHSLQFIPSNL